MTIFIKPNSTHHNTYYILALFDETLPRLDRVVFTEDEADIITFIDECNPADDDRIMFDGTYHAQTGIDLRRATERNVFIYRDRAVTNPDDPQSRKAANQIAAQASWIAKNMQYNVAMQKDKHFKRFLQLERDYSKNRSTANPTAAELMAAAARYFRTRATF